MSGTPYSLDKTQSSKKFKSGKSSDSSFDELIDEINEKVSNSLSMVSDEEEEKKPIKLKKRWVFKPSYTPLKRSETLQSHDIENFMTPNHDTHSPFLESELSENSSISPFKLALQRGLSFDETKLMPDLQPILNFSLDQITCRQL